MQEENMVEHNYAVTINESQPADPHLATALEGRFVGKCGKQSVRRDAKRQGTRMCLLQRMYGKSSWTLAYFL
jgi:hypothetical protein